MDKKLTLDETKNLWEKEPNEWVLKATKQLNEYPMEVQRIIINEAEKRGLVMGKLSLIEPENDAQKRRLATQKSSAVKPESGNSLYSGFWRRAFAYIFDTTLLEVAYLGVILIFGNAIAAVSPESALWAIVISDVLIRICLLNWFYFAFMESSQYQATLGKQLFGIIVQNAAGKRISFWRASARYFAPMILSIPYFIACVFQWCTFEFNFSLLSIFSLLSASGGLLILFTRRKQAFHDLVTQCVVVHRQPDTGKLHNLSPWLTSLIITGVFIVSTANTIVNNDAFDPDRPEFERSIVAIVLSIVYTLPLFVLILVVKRVRNKHKSPPVKSNVREPSNTKDIQIVYLSVGIAILLAAVAVGFGTNINERVKGAYSQKLKDISGEKNSVSLENNETDEDMKNGDKCLLNLLLIDAYKEQFKTDFNVPNGYTISPALWERYEKRWPFSCPSGGTYTIGKIGEKASCSVLEHAFLYMAVYTRPALGVKENSKPENQSAASKKQPNSYDGMTLDQMINESLIRAKEEQRKKR